MKQKKSIGILGGMGPLATADLFRKIVERTDAPNDNAHIRIYIDNHAQIPDRTAAILREGEDPFPYMKESLDKLVSCGADLIVMPCNTAHYYLPRLAAVSPVPFLSILDATAHAAKARFPGKTAAVLATTGTIRSSLYQEALTQAGVPFLAPEQAEQEALMRVIYDGVKSGRDAETYRADMEHVVSAMREAGAGYMIYGCTELPVAAAALGIDAPFIDPTFELAGAAVTAAGYRLRQA